MKSSSWNVSVVVVCVLISWWIWTEDVDKSSVDKGGDTRGMVYANFSSIYTIFELSKLGYPLVFMPVEGAKVQLSSRCKEKFQHSSNAARVSSASALGIKCFILENREWIRQLHLKHGALLLRGFEIAEPLDFESVAQELMHPLELFGGVYLGTSPRVKEQERAAKVYTASEIPSTQVIPLHLEMSFIPQPPSQIAFWSKLPNQGPGGETPLCDFRELWREMRPEVAARFKSKGIRYSRSYYSDQRPNHLKPWISHYSFTKSWEDMFKTKNKSQAEQMALDQGFQVDWLHGEAGMMRLSNAMNATRIHPQTGDEHWNNHLAVLHANSWFEEYAAAAERTDSWRLKVSLYFNYVRGFLWNHIVMFALGGGPEALGTNVMHADGDEIAEGDMQHFRKLMAKSVFTEKWQSNDIMMLDNYRIAHGRHSFFGPRLVYTTWSSQ